MNKAKFLNEFADLIAKYKIAICSRRTGKEHSEVFFLHEHNNERVEISTCRTHSTAYELRRIAKRIALEDRDVRITTEYHNNLIDAISYHILNDVDVPDGKNNVLLALTRMKKTKI